MKRDEALRMLREWGVLLPALLGVLWVVWQRVALEAQPEIGDGALHFEELTDNAWGNARIFQKVIRNPKQFLCLQDSMSEPKTKVLAGIHKFYESLFPTKAPWEK